MLKKGDSAHCTPEKKKVHYNFPPVLVSFKEPIELI